MRPIAYALSYRSFESPSASVRNSISSAPDENSVDETNLIPAAPTSDGTKLDKGGDDEGSVEATPVQESAPSIQPGLTVCVELEKQCSFHGQHTDVNRSKLHTPIILATIQDQTMMSHRNPSYMLRRDSGIL